MASNSAHSNLSNRTPEDDSEDEDSSYFDVMMIGKTGSGKSTVGNKLLDIDPETKMLLGVYRVGDDINTMIKQWDFDGDQKPYFETGDSRESVTKRCKVLSNEKNKDRVLDTRGFADTENTRQYGVIKGNLQSFRWILQAQEMYNLRFSRVLYFFPNRGPPERADGTLQEEMSVMHSFFGQQIFDVMVIIVTNHKRDHYQQAGFSEEDFADTREVFMSAFHRVTGTDLPKCPPVIYIPFNEDPDSIMKSVVSADVISDAERLYFSAEDQKSSTTAQEDVKSSVKLSIDMSREEKKHILRTYRGKCFQFEDRCARCCFKIVQEKLPSGKEIPLEVMDKKGSKKAYDDSHCHPFFIPKHSQFVKFVGGVVHIVTLGMGIAYEKVSKKKSWPGFSNSEEVCVHCNMPPGSNGCAHVNQWIKIGTEYHMTNHSKKLDTLQLLADDDTN